uniref:Uncharacterized protein n=1 Tax=Glossina pallidipes TaxID=7398 RepID=A0A1A9ZYQ2_GLOPL
MFVTERELTENLLELTPRAVDSFDCTVMRKGTGEPTLFVNHSWEPMARNEPLALGGAAESSSAPKDFPSVDEYVNEVLTIAHKLRSAGLQPGKQWIGSIMLAGLTEGYEPMIMGIQRSRMPIQLN